MALGPENKTKGDKENLLIENIKTLGLVILGILGAIGVLILGLAVLTYYLSCPFIVIEGRGTTAICTVTGEPCKKLKFLRFKQCTLFWDGMEEVLKK